MTERQSIQNLPTYGTIYDEEEALYAGELPEVYYSPVSNEDHNFPPVLMDMYEKYMESHPVLTTVVQTFLLVLFSDICAQVIRAVLTKEASSFDWVRLYAVGTWSIIFMGPSKYTE